ncbi:trypsin-like peptidase domain-containing protein [Streptomyces sp. NPDC006733]|uniref:S1C family serine protease n=1 Tax=Streptomyces sp. NPDC006733 TaxID=3155460 RepID=UPI0034089A31
MSDEADRPQWWSHPAGPVPGGSGAGAPGPAPDEAFPDPYLLNRTSGGHPAPGGGPDRPRGGRALPLIAGAALIALLAGGIGGAAGVYAERHSAPESEPVTLPQASEVSADRARDSVAGIAARTLPGVVYIHVKGSAGEDTGTGFVLDTRGHILTNNHVVGSAGKGADIQVTFTGGQRSTAKVVGVDSGYDLAVIEVGGVSGLRPLVFGNSDSVRVGDPVVAIGAPYGLEGTVTAGIISATRRPVTAAGTADGSEVSYVDALQTDAPINPGNSGGPLVDGQGRVIGINSAIRAADDGGPAGGQGGSIGLGFAIPANQAKRVAEELINTGRATHPVIGVSVDMAYEGDGARVGGKAGTAAVTPGGPGDRAGITSGDVVTAVDGERVHRGEELIVKIRSHRPGDRLTLTLVRDGSERTVELTLGSATGD